jgi:hypothetical protein
MQFWGKMFFNHYNKSCMMAGLNPESAAQQSYASTTEPTFYRQNTM